MKLQTGDNIEVLLGSANKGMGPLEIWISISRDGEFKGTCMITREEAISLLNDLTCALMDTSPKEENQ